MIIKFFGKTGWGDVIYPLMYAHRLAHEHKSEVVLLFQWPKTLPLGEHTLGHPDDKHSMYEILEIVNELFWKGYGSVIIKHERDYKGLEYWTLPEGSMNWFIRTDYEIGKTKTIAFWTPELNIEHPDLRWPTTHKKDIFTNKVKNKWPILRKALHDKYGENYEIKELSYRTDFNEALKIVRNCEFCVGYYGLAIVFATMFRKPTFMTSDFHSNRHVPWFNQIKSIKDFIETCDDCYGEQIKSIRIRHSKLKITKQSNKFRYFDKVSK